jgi:hypothetical protein
VLAVREARDAGWTQSALRQAVATGRIVRLRPGAFRERDWGDTLDAFAKARWDHAAPAFAATLTTPGAVASHSTAAVLLELPLLFLPELPCVSVVPWHTGDVAGTHVHRTGSAIEHVVSRRGVECTSPSRTVVDLAREQGVRGGVVAADAALHSGCVSLDELWATVRQCRRWPGVRAAREAVARADERSESPLESVSRLALCDHGLPAPDLQRSICDRRGSPIGRVDLYWDELGVVGEVDGMQKYDDRDGRPLRSEKLRQERLEEAGLIVVRWGWADLKQFEGVAGRLRRAFSRGADRPAHDRRWRLLPYYHRPTSTLPAS